MVVVAVVIALVLVVLAAAALSVRILKQYERAVVFRLGRVEGGARGPGLIAIVPLVDRVHRVSLRIVTMPIQSQGIITRDNVSVDVSAVAYYRVADAVRSVVAIENVAAAINQIAQTTLRAVVGRHTLDETLSETEAIIPGAVDEHHPGARRVPRSRDQSGRRGAAAAGAAERRHPGGRPLNGSAPAWPRPRSLDMTAAEPALPSTGESASAAGGRFAVMSAAQMHGKHQRSSRERMLAAVLVGRPRLTALNADFAPGAVAYGLRAVRVSRP